MPVVKIGKCINCGIKHEWLFQGATLMELRMIKQLTGMNGKAFAAAGDELDPEALSALIYVLHKRDKITVPFDDIDLDFTDFEMVPTEEELKAIEEIEKQQAANSGNNAGPKAR